ncbi:unnamed protein product, partial [Prorocentrum cordatum]
EGIPMGLHRGLLRPVCGARVGRAEPGPRRGPVVLQVGQDRRGDDHPRAHLRHPLRAHEAACSEQARRDDHADRTQPDPVPLRQRVADGRRRQVRQAALFELRRPPGETGAAGLVGG